MSNLLLATLLSITAIASYFIGNINFAVIISKASKGDIRTSGSGNPGTMNMLRTYGAKLGILTLLLDALKGFVPSFIAKLAFSGVLIGVFEVSDLALFVAGISTTIGHIFPVTMGFKGGKGVATTLGMFIASSPLISLAFFFLGVLYIFLFEYGSMGSMLFLSAMAISQGLKFSAKYVIGGSLPEGSAVPYFVLCVLIFASFAITWLAHKQNIYKLIFGFEHKTKLKRIVKKMGKKED